MKTVLKTVTHDGHRIVWFLYWHSLGYYTIECQYCHTLMSTHLEPEHEWQCFNMTCGGVGMVFKR